MGMVLCLRTVSDATLEHVLSDPDSVNDLLDDATVEDDGTLTDEGLHADLDKAWHAIHFLLTRSVWEGKWPEAFLLVGGRQIGDVDVGYGPARGLTRAETAAVAEMLARITVDELASRFDGRALDHAKVYPEIWSRDGDDALEYLKSCYSQLREFVSTARAKKMGMLIFMV